MDTNKITQKCLSCGKTFIDYASRERKFCSISCSTKYQKKNEAKRKADCHPDRPHKGLGLCKPCLAVKNSLWRGYKITPEQWEKLYQKQEGKCPICVRPISKPGNSEGKRAANVDHDHKTGRVRGLTCHICNRNRIGTNNLETAKRLVVYLESSLDGREL